MRKIICGDIHYEFCLNPKRAEEKAIELIKLDSFCIESNSAPFVELVHLLIDDIIIILKEGNKEKEITFREFIVYIGDIYDIVENVELEKEFGDFELIIEDDHIFYNKEDYNHFLHQTDV